MKPSKAAHQVTRLWRETISPGPDPYPVDCRKIAEALKAKVHGEYIDDDFEAQLRIRLVNGRRRKVIIYNENIREQGRRNFCIAHEIGHLSCHLNQPEFFCTSADLNDIAPHPTNIEQEANRFAATLLMPADDFRLQVAGVSPTLRDLGKLANERYSTSLTATSARLIELSPRRRFGMAILRGRTVLRWQRTDAMKVTGFGFKRGHVLPDDVHHNPAGHSVPSDRWLTSNSARWELTQSSVHMPYYNRTLVLVCAEQLAGPHHHDDETSELMESLTGRPDFR